MKKQRERGESKKRDRVRRRRSRTLILRLEFSIFVHNHKALRSLKNLFGFFFPHKEVLYFEALIGIDSLSIFIFFSSKPGWNFNFFPILRSQTRFHFFFCFGFLILYCIWFQRKWRKIIKKIDILVWWFETLDLGKN